MMSFSIKRIQAIFVKDYKEFSRNYAVSIVMLLMPLLAVFYGRTGIHSLDTYYLLFNMTFAMVATYVQSCLIAEEKEKNTLRGLLLSPASMADILIGKSSLTFVVTAVTLLFVGFFSDYSPENMMIIIIAFAISTIFYIGLGTLIGLFTKSVMEASVYSLPVMGLFSAGTFIPLLFDKYPILQPLEYLPNIQLINLASKVEEGLPLTNMLLEFFIIGVWAILIFLLAAYVYKKQMKD